MVSKKDYIGLMRSWLRVVWTDESTYSTKGFGHRPMVLRRPDEEYHPDCIDEIWESGRKSQMVWGAFCGELKSELFFVPSGAKINGETYTTEILDPLLIPFWHQTCEFYGWTIVMEDGAPGHKGVSKICREDQSAGNIRVGSAVSRSKLD